MRNIIKKISKIILINITLLILLIFISDLFIYNYKMSKGLNHNPHYNFGYITSNPDIAGFNLKNYFDNNYRKYKGRFPDGLEFKNKTPIVVFGCSYAFGQGLETNQTFSYKLAHILKRPVYNRAMAGGSFQQMYYQAADKGSDFFYKEVPSADTVIYVMMDNHYERILRYVHFNFFKPSFYPVYKEKNNELILENYKNPIINIIKSSYTIKQINIIYSQRYVKNIKNKDKLTDIITLYCIKTKENLEKNWGRKINFIVIFYPQIKYEKELQKKLEENNIKVINIKDLTNIPVDLDEKYKQQDGHPSEAAWDIITPIVAKKLTN